MTIESRWKVPIPRCSLQQWIFGSPSGPLPDRKAFIDPDRPETHFVTFADYRLLAKRIALGLQAEGLKAGDRVLLYSGNGLHFPSFFLGVLMAGGVFTGANPASVVREVAYQLRDSAASIFVVAESVLDTALKAAEEVGLPKEKIFIFGGDSAGSEIVHGDHPRPGAAGRSRGIRHWSELLQGNLNEAQRWDWAEPQDPENTTCCLNYSSGTTGAPKGVEISHYSYVANGVGVIYVSDMNPDAEAQRDRARVLCFLPLYHAFAQTYFVANFARLGVPVYVMPSFDFVNMLTYIQRYRITALTCVPPIVVALAKHPLVAKFDLSSLETIACGAAPLSREVAVETENRFPRGQVALRQGWGMTEVTCTCMTWEPSAPTQQTGVGELMPNCAARLVDPDSGAAVTTPGVPGELWVTGPTLMRGYWGRPDATRDSLSIDADGTRWLKTGDIAFVEDKGENGAGVGYAPGAIFRLVDRLKELIKVKGNQVAPAELEALLLERPDVLDAAVVGVTVAGEERPRAYVVAAPAARATADEIAAWVADKVTAHKRLRGGVAFIDQIPKNPVSAYSLPFSV